MLRTTSFLYNLEIINKTCFEGCSKVKNHDKHVVMTSSSQLSASSNELIQNERLLSLLLFDQIRPVCIELSEASTLQPFNTNKVVNLMILMEDILKSTTMSIIRMEILESISYRPS